jgi:hypothetical protein
MKQGIKKKAVIGFLTLADIVVLIALVTSQTSTGLEKTLVIRMYQKGSNKIYTGVFRTSPQFELNSGEADSVAEPSSGTIYQALGGASKSY